MGQEQDISSFIEEINTSFAAFKDSKNTDIQGSRAQALEAARKLSAALATPEETVLHHSYEVSGMFEICDLQLTIHRSLPSTYASVLE